MHRTTLPLAVAALSLAGTGFATAAGDYDGLSVAETIVLDDMEVGGSDTAALLSPNGSRLLYIGETLTCLYEVEGSTLEKGACSPFSGAARDPADTFWSPNGSLLVWSTAADAFVYYDDTDIRVASPSDSTLRTLTDDRYQRTVISAGPADFDVAGQWLDDDTIVFARYPVTAEGINSLSEPAPSLMTVNLEGDVAPLLGPLPTEGGLIYSIDVSADGRRIAYIVDGGNADIAGVSLFDLGSNAPRRIAATSQFDYVALPKALAFSADGKFLALQGQKGFGLTVFILEVETGAMAPLSLGDRDILGVAWSPTGSTLAYIVDNGMGEGDGTMPDGLYISEPPGTPGRLVVEGSFAPPTCCGIYPIVWATNNTMVLGNGERLDRPFLLRFE